MTLPRVFAVFAALAFSTPALAHGRPAPRPVPVRAVQVARAAPLPAPAFHLSWVAGHWVAGIWVPGAYVWVR
jgi:hypothetical protein